MPAYQHRLMEDLVKTRGMKLFAPGWGFVKLEKYLVVGCSTAMTAWKGGGDVTFTST